jgi:hypothetical protein
MGVVIASFMDIHIFHFEMRDLDLNSQLEYADKDVF